MPLRRLRPVSARRGYPITLAALLLPAVGIVLLAKVESVRRPLAEDEAAIAVAMQSAVAPGPTAPAAAVASPGDRPVPSAAAVALARIGPLILGGGELPLRVAGLVAGALALGATVRLGERLFATRVGVIAAALLLAAPEGRALLGTRLTVDPFLLLPMLVALRSIRNFATAKVSAIHAGLASGVAVAVTGVSALWLPALAIGWLHRLRGLDPRSFALVTGWTIASALVTSTLASLLLGWGSAPLATWAPPLEDVSLRDLALGVLPIVPLAILGAWHLPPAWARSESLRFVGWWFAASGTSALVTGSIVGPATALLFALAALAAWAFDRAPRRLSWSATAAAILLVAVTPGAVQPPATLERWATREAARFVRNVLPEDRRVAAADGAARRIAFYSQRDITALGTEADLRGIDYVIVDRAALRALGGELRRSGRQLAVGDVSMRVLAEFGPWLVARTTPPPAAPGARSARVGRAPGPALPASANQ